MDSSFTLNNVSAAIIFFTTLCAIIFFFYRKSKSHQENKTVASSSSLVPLSLPQNWKHHVFPSFHGADVRKAFLSHFLKEFRSKGIDPFIDNNIERSKSIGPELVEAIRGSRIAIFLLSKNYTSSTWCLDELVEIIKCREEFGQTVMVLFYEVDPTEVKKQTGEFGKMFRKTCKGKTKEAIERWKHALGEVAKIAGYHSKNWDNEAEMIEKFAIDVSNKLNNSTQSSDFDGLVGMECHMIKMRPLLQLASEKVRIIGILGPPGIGKTTIARFLYNRHSLDFQMSVFMENIKTSYAIPACSDNYKVKLYLQEQFMSQLINHIGLKIPNLGVAKDRLKDKKVLVVLDDVDQLVQLEAIAKETCWFGPWSRIIITTQDQKILKASGVNHIYRVGFPSSYEALQMFCIYAFGQKSPKKGFMQLAREVTRLVGALPLGLRVMGSYFRGMSKQDWTKALPRLMTRLDGEIESILKFSYDALCDEDKNLFLHIACFFNREWVDKVEGCLENSFVDVTQGLHLLVEKSLISLDDGIIRMHNLLVQLGKEIVRKQSNSDPGKRQFLDDARDICEVLSDDRADSSSVIGIDLRFSHDNKENTTCTGERTFERLSSLQFLRIDGCDTNLYSPRSLNSIPHKLRLLSWERFQMSCFPSGFHPKFLVKLDMQFSKLEKLWEEIQPLSNLKWMDLSNSKCLKELPDLSTATNLCELNLSSCSRLVELPSSIGNAINLRTLDLSYCRRLMELPSSIGNAVNLRTLDLSYCRKLMELPSSIGNAINLQLLNLNHCSSLRELPFAIGNAINLQNLKLSFCQSLVELPSSIGNAINLQKLDLSHCSSLVELPFSIGNATNLDELDLSYCSSLVELPSSIGNATHLGKLDLLYCSSLIKLHSTIGSTINLKILDLSHCSSLVNLPFSIGNSINLQSLKLSFCKSLVELPSSIGNAINLQRLNLDSCSSMVQLPSSIGNAINLEYLNLSHCSSLVELPSSTGNATNLEYLNLSHCSSLVGLPSSIGNANNLCHLILTHCSSLVELPFSIGNAINLYKLDLSHCSNLLELPSSMKKLCRLSKLDLEKCSKLEVILTNINLESLQQLNLSDCSMLKSYSETSTNSEVQELGPWIGRVSLLHRLVLSGMQKLVLLSQLPDSISFLDAENCESLEILDCSFRNPDICLNFSKCFKLNQEARDLIIHTPTNKYTVLPGKEVPMCFTYRASGSSLTLKLNQKHLHTSTKFKACILVAEMDNDDSVSWGDIDVSCIITSKQNRLTDCIKRLEPVFPEHLYIFEIEAVDVTSTELVFEFELDYWTLKTWEVKECGILLEDPSC